MSDSKSNSSGGIGLSGATFLVFLILKLCGVINWSWWWVTAPLWGTLVLVLLVIATVVIVAAFGSAIAAAFSALFFRIFKR